MEDDPDGGHDTASAWAGQHQRLHRRDELPKKPAGVTRHEIAAAGVLFLGATNSGICFSLKNATTTCFNVFHQLQKGGHGHMLMVVQMLTRLCPQCNQNIDITYMYRYVSNLI